MGFWIVCLKNTHLIPPNKQEQIKSCTFSLGKEKRKRMFFILLLNYISYLLTFLRHSSDVISHLSQINERGFSLMLITNCNTNVITTSDTSFSTLSSTFPSTLSSNSPRPTACPPYIKRLVYLLLLRLMTHLITSLLITGCLTVLIG